MFCDATAGISIRIRSLALVALLAGAFGTVGVHSAQGNEQAHTTIILLHTNDLHFDFNFLDEVEEKILRFREQYADVFLLDAGDISNRPSRWQDGMNGTMYEERLLFMINIMNILGYDAVTLGNHDLGYYETITRDIFRQAEFPLLGANVQVATDNFDQPDPYIVLETSSGIQLAVLGLCGGGFDNAEGITLSSVPNTVEEYAYLKDEHDALILLTHIGDRRDRALADRFGDRVDVIIGGHTHVVINPAELVNGVLVAQAGGHLHVIDPTQPQHLGVIRLLFDDQGTLVSKEGEVLQFDIEGYTRSRFLGFHRK